VTHAHWSRPAYPAEPRPGAVVPPRRSGGGTRPEWRCRRTFGASPLLASRCLGGEASGTVIDARTFQGQCATHQWVRVSNRNSPCFARRANPVTTPPRSVSPPPGARFDDEAGGRKASRDWSAGLAFGCRAGRRGLTFRRRSGGRTTAPGGTDSYSAIASGADLALRACASTVPAIEVIELLLRFIVLLVRLRERDEVGIIALWRHEFSVW
jgi:hypothetical protein